MSKESESLLTRYEKLRILPDTQEEGSEVSGADSPTFTCFSKLPIELRLKIWIAACFHGRNVDLWVVELEITKRFGSSYFESYFDSDDSHVLHQFVSGSCPPAILHCCHESREEGLKHYELSFSVLHRLENGLTVSKKAHIYINWKADRLCLMNPDVYHREPLQQVFKLSKRKGLHAVAIAVDLYEEDGQFKNLTYSVLDAAQSWPSAISDVILFPSIHNLTSNSHHPWTTANVLLDYAALGVTMRWDDNIKQYPDIEKCLDPVQKHLEESIERLTGPRKLASGIKLKADEHTPDVLMSQLPKIRVCDVVYEWEYESRRNVAAS